MSDKKLMKNRFSKKQKNIKKPVFAKIFIPILLAAVILSVLVAHNYLIYKKNEANKSVQVFFQDNLNELESAVDDATVFGADLSENSLCMLRIKWALSRMYMDDMNVYAEVYLKDKKILDTTQCLPCVVATNRSPEGNWYPYAYYLKDPSYLDPIREYIDQGYYYDIESAFFDPLTHTFIPGNVCVYPTLFDRADAETIKCKPDDLGECKKYETLFTFSWCSRGIFTKAEPRIDRVAYYYTNDDFSVFEMEDVPYPYEKQDEAIWSIRYKDYEGQSIKELYPVKRWVISGIALAIAVTVSLVVSLILYFRKKTLFEIFDYRKKTTEAMAHDLKTPLATISAYAESLEEGLSEGGTAAYDPEKEKQNREYAKKIRENVNDMNDMVEGILQFSKSEGSGGKIVMQETDIRQIIGGCMIKYDGLFKQKSITLSVSGETPSQNTDPKLLTQAIDNLFSNCARYADEESEVRIVLSENDIKISNRFSGSISNVEELKKPFVKGETSRSQKGSGLGLSIVDNDLKLLGYKLELSFENGIFTATVVLR